MRLYALVKEDPSSSEPTELLRRAKFRGGHKIYTSIPAAKGARTQLRQPDLRIVSFVIEGLVDEQS